jgi:[protein-PII] uridylyltransferase
LSNTAFRRDVADPKTIEDFVGAVQSPERLRLLLILTVVDIRAVGPTTWNDWKRRLLRALFDAAEERLRLGHKQRGRAEQVAARQQALADALAWKSSAARAHARRLPDSYWLAEPDSWQVANALQVADAEARIGDPQPSVVADADPVSGMTRISVFAPDRPGLFYRIVAALSVAGASIVDARIHTTRDGMALDNLLITDARGRGYEDSRTRRRVANALEKALRNDHEPVLKEMGTLPRREEVFRVAPRVLIADKASTRTTVVEVNARDRPGLLARLAGVIHAAGLELHSAHIATYGERAVDVFYLTDAKGRKLDTEASASLRQQLLDVASEAN